MAASLWAETSNAILGPIWRSCKLTRRKRLPFLKLGDNEAMEMGDRVLAIGALARHDRHGDVGNHQRQGKGHPHEHVRRFLPTDAAIDSGNSGGPLVNLAGEVVGVNSAIRSDTGGFQGIGLAISSNLTKTVVEQLQRNGTVARGYLGVQTQPLIPKLPPGSTCPARPALSSPRYLLARLLPRPACMTATSSSKLLASRSRIRQPATDRRRPGNW